MKKAKTTKVSSSGTIPWHVFSFAAYSILALLAQNLDQVAPASALPPLVLSLAGAGSLLLLARLWLRDWQRAALLTTILLVLFFTYGHVYSYLKAVTVSGVYLFRHRTLAPLWIALAGLAVWWVGRRKPQVQGLTRLLNVVGLVLLVFPLFQVVSGMWRHWRAWERSPAAADGPGSLGGGAANQASPDIYYIILDGYARADRLEKDFGYDNSVFIGSLEQIGFYVAACSQSNYAQTELSVASELNYDYLNALGDTFVPDNDDRSPLWPLIRNSALRRVMEARGYQTIAFKTGFSWTEWTDADRFLGPQLSKWQLDGFQYMWLQTTLGRILLDAEALRMLKSPEELFRHRTEYALQALTQIPSIQGPKLVFAHLIVPHPPYVFGPNGEPVSIGSDATSDVVARAYLDQVTFINRRMLEILPAIIAASETPPIIIIQGDHGVAPTRMANLSAFYLPGHESLFYPSITNVNTFRVVLDEYFGQDLPLLPDSSLYSTYDSPYNFHAVENDCSR